MVEINLDGSLVDIGERMQFLRDKVLNTSQDEIAKFIGMSRSNLSSIETGRINPSLQAVLLYAYFCNVSPAWILKGIGQGPNPVKTNRRNLSVKLLDNAVFTADTIIKELPARFKFCRENAEEKISQRKLSEMLEISQSVISEIERGNLVPTIEYIIKFSENLEVPIDLLLSTPEQLLLMNADSLSEHPLYGQILSSYTPKRELIKAEDIIFLIQRSFSDSSELRKMAAVIELIAKYIDQENRGGKE
ncbi:MAG: helix-turn-helix domain-containing protein [Bacteroidota bacterium]